MPRKSAETPASSRLVRKPAVAARRMARPTGRPPATPVGSRHDDFAAACLPHRGELFGVAMRLARSSDDAKDLVQETLIRAMCAWDRFEPGTNLRAWLLRILTNSFINGYRKRRRHARFAAERPGD